WAIYIRVSTLMQAERGFSLPAQIKDCREGAALRKLPPVPDDYVLTDADSGKSFYRADLDRLMTMAAEGQLEGVIFPKVDRMCRNTRDGLEIVERLNALGVRMVFLTENVDTTTAAGKFMLTQWLAMAELEGTSIVERTTRGRKEKLAQGKTSSPEAFTPYGLVYIPGDRKAKIDGRYEIVWAEAKIVIRIFESLARGVSMNQVAVDLTRDGIPTPRGKGTTWYPTTIRKILDNTAYLGALRRNEWRVVYDLDKETGRRGKKRYERNPPESLVYVPVPAILGTPELRELVAIAKDMVAGNRKVARRHSNADFLLRSTQDDPLLFCGDCLARGQDHRMGARTIHRKDKAPDYRIYLCQHYTETGRRKSHHVSADKVETAVWETLTDLLGDERRVLADLAALADVASAQSLRLQDELETLDGRAAEIAAREKKVAFMFERNLIDETILLERSAAIVREKQEVEGRMALLRVQLQQARENQIPVDEIRHACRILGQGLEAAPFERKQWAIRVLLTRVIATREKVVIEGHLPSLHGEREIADTTLYRCGR
ncbi:MAG TPA: recombinase family protein, partial [Chloroflexota bacterium]|nr:recombinase family protein [Chloroflexota bacterium]